MFSPSTADHNIANTVIIRGYNNISCELVTAILFNVDRSVMEETWLSPIFSSTSTVPYLILNASAFSSVVCTSMKFRRNKSCIFCICITYNMSVLYHLCSEKNASSVFRRFRDKDSALRFKVRRWYSRFHLYNIIYCSQISCRVCILLFIRFYDVNCALLQLFKIVYLFKCVYTVVHLDKFLKS